MNNLNVQDEDVRRIVRDEMARASPSSAPPSMSPSNLYRRTQGLIRSRVKSECNPQSTPTLIAAPAVQHPSAPAPALQHPPGKRSISQTGHPWRLKPVKAGKAKKPKPITEKLIYAWLLDYPNEEDIENNEEEYIFSENMVLTKGYVKLSSNDDHLMVQSKLLELFNTKFPEVQQFSYLKRERQKLSVPITPKEWEWGFDNLKALMGQGKLYCRLYEKFSPNRNDHDDVDYSVSPTSNIPCSKSDKEVVSVSDGEDTELPDVSDSLQQQNTNDQTRIADLQTLVHDLVNSKNGDSEKKKFVSLQEAISYLSAPLKKDDKKRLRVQPEYALEEAFAYLKSADFEPLASLVIRYKGQPAIDTGGVLRQFYSDCFDQMCSNDIEDFPQMFEGGENDKVPVHNAGIVLSGLLELAGKLMAHSIAHTGISIGCLAPCAYQYLATGDISRAMEYIMLSTQTASPVIKHYIDKVSDKSVTDESLQNVFLEEEFQNLFYGSGMTHAALTLNNCEEIMQGIIFNELLQKRIPALDQLRKGLQLLGVGEIIKENVELFEDLFCFKAEHFTSEALLKKITFNEDQVQENRLLHDYFLHFLANTDKQNLEKFCKFCTGCRLLPIHPTKIKVSYEGQGQGFVASTCLHKLEIPVIFQSQEEFISALIAIIGGNEFSTV